MQPGIAKKGMKVRISNDLENSQTKENWNLDEAGNMLSMQGKIFPIREVDSLRALINYNTERYYSFHFDDLEPEDIPKQKSIEFKFDERLLDI